MITKHYLSKVAYTPIQFFYTIINLKWVQIYFRFMKPLRYLRKYNFDRVLLVRPIDKSKYDRDIFIDPVNTKILSEKTISIFNVESNFDWNAHPEGMLWLYNLHYFDFLVKSDLSQVTRQTCSDIMDDWVLNNKVPKGVGWDPYPVSRRIVSWIKYFIRYNIVEEKFIKNLSLQCDYLYRNIEWHLLGNHLFANAIALIYSGIFFDGYRAKLWLLRGLQILEVEIDEQILKDGGHFERSPMYHSSVLRDILDLIEILELYDLPETEGVRLKCRSLMQRMTNWLDVMCHPDGDISFFNDSTLGVEVRASTLKAKARQLGCEPVSNTNNLALMEESGFARLEHDKAVVICDVGGVGPAYIPGHAHAGTLSYELSIFKKRLVVNSGISTYERGALRSYQRSTSAHSTVEVDEGNSSDVWSSFRVGKRAKVTPIECSLNETGGYLTCAHDGYMSLWGTRGVLHQRTWRWSERCISICDELTGTFRSAVSTIYIHPHWDINICDSKIFITHGSQRVSLRIKDGSVSISPSQYFVGFGRFEENRKVLIPFISNSISYDFCW